MTLRHRPLFFGQDLRLHVGSEMPCPADDRVPVGKAPALELFEGRGHIGSGSHSLGKREGVCCSFRDPHAYMGLATNAASPSSAIRPSIAIRGVSRS